MRLSIVCSRPTNASQAASTTVHGAWEEYVHSSCFSSVAIPIPTAATPQFSSDLGSKSPVYSCACLHSLCASDSGGDVAAGARVHGGAERQRIPQERHSVHTRARARCYHVCSCSCGGGDAALVGAHYGATGPPLQSSIQPVIPHLHRILIS
jgi:hypothetical protein